MLLKVRGVRPRERCAFVVAVASLSACAERGAATPTTPPLSNPAVVASAKVPTASAAPVDTHGVSLEPLAAAALPAVLPHVEIVEPAFGDRLDVELARRTAIKLRLENAPLSAEREGVLVALDGGRPRRFVETRPLTLGDLLPEDAELSTGAHTLLAVAVGSDGRALRAEGAAKKPLSLVAFFIGVRPASAPAAAPASVFCLSPVGTFYTKPDEPVVLDVLSFGLEKPLSTVRVTTRSFSFVAPFDSSRAFAIRGLPRGDVWLSVGENPRSECAVTLNPPLEARP